MPSSIADYPSVTSHTPRKGRHRVGEFDYSNQPLKVAVQKVNVEIDLATHTLDGETELTVLPLSPGLKVIKLDCRSIQVLDVFVNNKKCRFVLNDFQQNDEYLNDPENTTLQESYQFNERYDVNSRTIGIEQHHLYRGKFHPLFSDINDPDSPGQVTISETESLTVVLPENLKLRLQDANNMTFSPATGKSTHNTPITASSLAGAEKVYTPLTVKIVYRVKNPKEGILFHGGVHTDIPKEQWCCYTSNTNIGCSASSWVPCIDNFLEKPTWEVNVAVPKTLGDIGQTKIIGTKEAELAMRRRNILENDDDDAEAEEQAPEEPVEDSVEDSAILDKDLVVVCPDSTTMKEYPHHVDIGKKVIGFQFHNPSAPHHIGFAVGVFESMSITKLGEDDGPTAPPTAETGATEELGIAQMPLTAYFMPGKKAEVLNTCLFLPKALDFYSNVFGSFPFSSYSLVFVNDLPAQTSGFAGLTLVSTDLLYTPDLIEPMFETTETLAVALSQQYAGINVLPYSLNDFWCTVGISRYMAGQFMRKLYGWNHFKYLTKKRSDLVCDLDIGKRPLGNQLYRFPINEAHDFGFINLKAPLVLFILDRWMTKTDKSFGLSRVIPRIFLQAMSGDLVSGNCLSTAHFQHVCEKVGHKKLENFFQNWVHNSGTPIFRVTQRFNKKRMFIEMGIKQVNARETQNLDDFGLNDRSSVGFHKAKQEHRVTNFLNSASEVLSGDETGLTSHVFTGPMTIRIHEADGTPYEHIVDLKDAYTKFDIQYNTKYKRLKRPTKKEEDGAVAEKDDLKSVRMLGDVLTSQKEMNKWGLQGLTEEEMEARTGEAFEWIRADADFEWLCRIYVNQPDYMFQSQLNQDRDVEAQLDSVRFFSNATKPSPFYFTVLVRTLLDSRYHFGVRVEAAFGLAKLSNQENNFIGVKYLLLSFKSLFCYDTNTTAKDDIDQIAAGLLPLPNDFSNFEDLFLRKGILEALATVRGSEGEIPPCISRTLINILKFNDNSANEFNDCYYISSVVSSLASVFLNTKIEDEQLKAIVDEGLGEIDRLLKLDEWVPSFRNTVSSTILHAKLNMARKGMLDLPFQVCLQLTKPGKSKELRAAGLEAILTLGGLRNAALLKYVFSMLKLDPSHSFRELVVDVFVKSVAIAGFENVPSTVDDEEFYEDRPNVPLIGGGEDLIVVDDRQAFDSRRSNQNTHAPVIHAINGARRDLSVGKGLRQELWNAVHSCLLSVYAKREIFDIIDVLFQAYDKFFVTVDKPMKKKLCVNYDSRALKNATHPITSLVVSIKLQGRLKVQLPMAIKRSVSVVEPARPIIKLKKDNPTKIKLEIRKPEDSPKPSVKLKREQPKFEVKFKYPAHKLASAAVSSTPVRATPKVDYEIVRSTPDTPLRYVKLFFNQKKKVIVSTDKFDDTPTLPVTLKVHPAILRAEEYRLGSKRKPSDDAATPVTKKSKQEDGPKLKLKLKF